MTHRWRAAAALAAGMAAAPAAAAAPPAARAEVSACLTAAEQAQPLRASGKLVEAREQLIICAAVTCPVAVRQDCARWLSDTEEALPSAILEARGANGEDLIDVKVLIDGIPVKSSLDGAALSLNPGRRVIRFESPGRVAVEQTVLVRQGERRRVVAATLLRPGGRESAVAHPRTASLAPAPIHSTPAPANGNERGTLPAASWILGGAALALGGAGLALWFVGKAEHDDMEQTCAGAGTCSSDDIAASRNKLIAGDVLLGAGIVAAGAGIVVALTGGPRRVNVSFGPRGIVTGLAF